MTDITPGSITPAGTTTAEMGPLFEKLDSEDGVERERARERLVEYGGVAVPQLVQLLGHHRHGQVRWEAAKALRAIADPTSASALVDALQDKDTDVRWVAAEALVALEAASLRPLFAALIKNPNSVWLNEGAHHILHELRDTPLAYLVNGVFSIMSPGHPSTTISIAAHEALRRLQAEEATG